MGFNTLPVVLVITVNLALGSGAAFTSQEVQNNSVKRHLGLENAKAFVGFLFKYRIPDEAFTGEISEYKVSEACEETLPAWLSFDNGNRTFTGLPQASDIGRAYICVKAIGLVSNPNSASSSAKDVFSIDVVVELTPSFSCPKEDSVVLGNVLVDVTLAQLQQPEFFRILESVGDVLHIPVDSVRLTPLVKKYDNTRNPVLLNGKGNSLKPNGQGARIQFQIGCSGDVITTNTSLVDYLDRNSANGELTRVIGYPVIEWEVRSGFPAGNVSPTQNSVECSQQSEDTDDSIDSTVVRTSAVPTVHRSHEEDHLLGENISHTTTASHKLNCTTAGLQTSPLVAAGNEFTTDFNASNCSTSTEPTKLIPTGSNLKPVINNRMKKLLLTAGKAFIYEIPEDTFVDFEDGDTRNLKLTFLTQEDEEAVSASHAWIYFDDQTQVLSALPLQERVGKYDFVLNAMDSNGSSTKDLVQINVMRHRWSRREFNHEFIMTLRYNKARYSLNVSWQTEIFNRLSRMFGHDDSSPIFLKSITYDPVKITWINDSLPSERCTMADIRKIYSKLASENGAPNKEFMEFMLPEFRIQNIDLKLSGACKQSFAPDKQLPNFSPILRRHIDTVHVAVGDVFKLKIPDDTFYDFEDGSTRNLKLTLHNTDHSEMSGWFQFDALKSETYGIAAEENAGQKDYVLKATDSDGLSASDVFQIHVDIPRMWSNHPVKFGIKIDDSFEEFNGNARRKVLLAEKISTLYGDANSQHLVVTSIVRGSVVFTWSNKTLLNEHCPMDKIRELSNFLVEDDGSPSAALIQTMHPEFSVIQVNITPASDCAMNPRDP